jgi:hypothetical protein
MKCKLQKSYKNNQFLKSIYIYIYKGKRQQKKCFKKLKQTIEKKLTLSFV